MNEVCALGECAEGAAQSLRSGAQHSAFQVKCKLWALLTIDGQPILFTVYLLLCVKAKALRPWLETRTDKDG